MTEPRFASPPLHDRHAALGAKFAPFGGWEMPLEYAGGGVLKEHAAVREAVGVFDVSTSARPRCAARARRRSSTAASPTTSTGSAPGQAQYTLCCDDATGGVVDDLIAYRFADDHVFLIPNAANTAEVVRRLRRRGAAEVSVTDQHEEYAVLAVQGPRSPAALAGARPADRPRLHALRAGHLRRRRAVVVCRTGYTGEHGYELVGAERRRARAVGRAARPPGARPCGLGARDTLRTEMGYPLHGQDLSAGHHAGAGPHRLGGRLEEAGVLGPGGAARGEGGRPAPHAVGPGGARPRRSRVPE